MSAGGTAEALAKVDKAGTAATVAQVLPPTVGITAPRPGRLDKGRQEVTAEARGVGPHPVTALRLLVDGRPWQGDKGVKTFDDAKPGAARASWSVDLPPGRHALAVQAESAVSKALSAPVEVLVAGDDGSPPNLYMVAVGISDYPAPMTLNYAAKDARVLSEVFRDKGRGAFGNVEVKLLTDRAATRRNIAEALAWLGSRMTARDVGIVSFSGHGMRDPRGRFYLVPVDVDDNDPAGTCIPGDAVKQALANMPGRLIAILDACHSGAAAAGKVKRQGSADDLVRDLVTDDYGVVVMCASLGSECALEGPDAAHGFFTLGLLEALNGKADFNHDRLIHLHEADTYARLRVRQLSQGRQNPVTGRPQTIRSFALAGLVPLSPRPKPTAPPAAANAPPARLADEVVRASAAEQDALIQKLRDNKGVEHTEALASAIPRLDGAAKQKARDALAQRLARLKADTLTEYLQDEDAEIRRAAALACAQKELKSHIPRLIPLLRDRQAGVAEAAHSALVKLSGQSLGPDPDAWEAWWKKQGKG